MGSTQGTIYLPRIIILIHYNAVSLACQISLYLTGNPATGHAFRTESANLAPAMPSTHIGRRGQITIPKAVRQSMCVEEGDPIAFVEKDGDFVLRPIRQSLRELRGSVPVSEPQDFDGIRESVKAARAERSSPAAESDAG